MLLRESIPGLSTSAAVLVLLFLILCLSCDFHHPSQPRTAAVGRNHSPSPAPGQSAPVDPNAWPRPRTDQHAADRARMAQLLDRGYRLRDERVLQAMHNVPRHWFVPADRQSSAYGDGPLPIGHGQTISQPYIVALMTSLLDLDPNDRVLEIGTGSGYQAAVLNEFTPHVYTIEIVDPLGRRAIETFQRHGYDAITARIGDGYQGWPDHAPFDAIIVTAAPDHIPQPLIDQLKPNGRMVIPVGGRYAVQDLLLITKTPANDLNKQTITPVRFVPLTRDK